jgi:hypothetical protein
LWVGFCVNIHFQLIWLNTKKHHCGIIEEEYVQLCKELPNCLSEWLLYHFAINESSCCSPVFGGVSILDFGCFNWHARVSYCYFNFQLPNDITGRTSLQARIWHQYVFFSEGSVQVTFFCNWVILFLLVEF